MSFQTYMTFFVPWNIKEGILKIVGNQVVLVLIVFHCFCFLCPYNGSQLEFESVYSILQNV